MVALFQTADQLAHLQQRAALGDLAFAVAAGEKNHQLDQQSEQHRLVTRTRPGRLLLDAFGECLGGAQPLAVELQPAGKLVRAAEGRLEQEQRAVTGQAAEQPDRQGQALRVVHDVHQLQVHPVAETMHLLALNHKHVARRHRKRLALQHVPTASADHQHQFAEIMIVIDLSHIVGVRRTPARLGAHPPHGQRKALRAKIIDALSEERHVGLALRDSDSRAASLDRGEGSPTPTRDPHPLIPAAECF